MASRARLPIPPPTDEQLIVAVANDDVDAFATLYDRYAARAFRVAYAVCRDAPLAEEAVQDGFLTCWKSRARYSTARGSVPGWLLMMVRCRAVDAARRNGVHSHRRALEDELEGCRAVGHGVFEAVTNQVEGEHLHLLLDRIPAAQREVISLAYFGELSHREIATQLHVPTGTVKGRLRLGLEKLRYHLEFPLEEAG